MRENSENNTKNNTSDLTLKNREELILSGVEDVDSFDENLISIYTCQGRMKIKGEKLNIIKISVESGNMQVVGKISGIIYIDEEKNSKGLLSKIFR